MSVQPRSLLYGKNFRLEVGGERVFAALSESEEQKHWFTEHSNALGRLHGSNAFWGKHTLGARTIKYATQFFTVFEPPKRLAYRWEVEKRSTEVTFELAGSKNSTRVSMKHEQLEGDADHFFSLKIADFWRIALLNLVWYLEKGAPMYRLDYSDCKGDVTLQLDINAPPPQVFQALVLPAKLDSWISHQARVEQRIGGRYDFGWTEMEGGQSMPAGPTVITGLAPDKKLNYGWHWPGEGKDTTVSWLLAAIKGGTQVSLSHAGFDPRRDSTDYKQGWAAFLCLLKLYLERGVKWED